MEYHRYIPVMSLRIRILQSLVLGLIGLSFIIYAVLNSSPVQNKLYQSNNHRSQHGNRNNTLKYWMNEVLPKPAFITFEGANGTIVEAWPDVLHKANSIDAKISSTSAKASSTSSTKPNPKVGPTYKLLNKDIYESGHRIPNGGLCPNLGKQLKLLILVTSSPNHLDARTAIRQTWGHLARKEDISMAFFVGTSSNSKVNLAIEQEAISFNDVVVARFVDTYDNLTLKTISMLEWVDEYCALVKFVLKTDDDMFINVRRLAELADRNMAAKRTMFGRLAKRWKPIRNSNSKYYIPYSQYSKPVFPDFLTGPAYLMTADLVHDLYTHALNSTFFKLEDVFLTGFVPQVVRLRRVHVNEFFNKKIPFTTCNVQKCISIHMVKFNEQFLLWGKLFDTKSECK